MSNIPPAVLLPNGFRPMNKPLPALLTIFCVAFSIQLSAEIAFAQPPARSGYEVAWFDEFNGNSLDTSRWTAGDTNVTTNFSLQDYLPSQVSVSGGSLRILSENIPSRGLPYRSGLVETKTYQKYGRWDIRAKLPTSKGMWPAIWLLADTTAHPWPSGGEIDIMENRGDQPNLTSSAFHYGINDGSNYQHNFRYEEQSAVHDGSIVNYHDSFHIYSVEWDPGQIRFYVDDVHHYTVRDSDVEGFLDSDVEEMRLILNTAIGGTFLDNPDGTTFWPQEFEIDYVHAYTRSAMVPVLTFENGGFEDNGGSMAFWSKFGDSLINNVSSGNQNVDEGTEALKLFGQFNGQQNYSGVEQGISVSAGDELRASARSFVDSGDSISGTDNVVYLKIDYYSEQYGLFGASEYISSEAIQIANSTTQNDTWLDNELLSVVPNGAVEARLAIVFEQNDNEGGAVFVDDVQFEVTGTLAPVVDNVELNSGEAQRSAVESITVYFEGDVSLAAGAVNVVQRSTQTDETFETVSSNFSRQLINNQTVVTIRFESHVRNSDNALVDGNYQLTLTGSLITSNGFPMSQDFVFGDEEAHAFYCFYSDSDGNRISNIFDLLAFRQSYRSISGSPAYQFYLDFDANGTVNVFDLLAFRSRYRTSLPFEFGSSFSSRQKSGSTASANSKKR
jgi:beta-glucanase (GH16 family)